MGSQIDPYTSAKQMLTMLASKEISAVELLEFHIDRIARHNPKINAIAGFLLVMGGLLRTVT